MHAGRIRDTGRVLKTVTVDVSKEPVNLLSRRRGGEFTIESREPSAFPQPDNLHHTSSFLDLLMRNLVTMSGERERERERGGERRGLKEASTEESTRSLSRFSSLFSPSFFPRDDIPAVNAMIPLPSSSFKRVKIAEC